MVIGFTVHDPRLRSASYSLRLHEYLSLYCSFPPKNAKLKLEGGPSLSPASTVFPSAGLAQSQIWDENTRMVLRKPKFKKKDLDQRRSNVSRDPPPHMPAPESRSLLQNLVPGTPLKSERNDDRVPVLLIHQT